MKELLNQVGEAGAIGWLSSSSSLVWLLLTLTMRWGLVVLKSYGLFPVGIKKKQHTAFLSHLWFSVVISIILLKEVVTLFSNIDKLNNRCYQYFIGFVGYFGWWISIWICNLIITIGLVMRILRTYIKYYFFHFFFFYINIFLQLHKQELNSCLR